MQTHTDHRPDAGPHVEVWNDLVSVRDLLLALAVCAASSCAALYLAQRAGGQLLFWGLGGAVLGFLVSCLLITPKREVSVVQDDGAEEARP